MILGCLEYQVVGVLVDVLEYEIYYGVLHMYVVIRKYSDFLEGFSAFNRMLLIDSF